MPIFILYLLKLSISLSIVWLFYQVVLRRLTFYTLNRWYLLGYSLLSFVIPLINIGPMMDSDPSRQSIVIQFIPAIGDYGAAGGSATVISAGGLPAGGWNRWSVLLVLLGLGAGLLLVRCLVRWFSLRGIRKQARLIGDTGIKIYQVDENIIPFSFGNAVYINQHLHTEKEWEEIILHEYVHIRQRHTADILLAELLCALNWYNPFAWLIRYSIRQNLEFIADDKVLGSGFDKKSYQYHLLKVIGEPRYRLANNFNFSSLKKRIIMMNKIRSARLHLLRFLFILPLITVLLVAFRGRYEGVFRQAGPRYIHAVGIVATYPDRQPLAGVSVLDKESGMTTITDARGFYRLRIPVAKDSMTVRMEYSKQGYSSDWSGHFLPAIGHSVGLIDIGLLISKGDSAHFMMKPPYFKRVPEDPSYADAVDALGDVFQEVLDMNRFSEMRTVHPEVALFYTTEDKEHQVVILANGEVEKYGYPGGPAVAEMEKKYGRLPEMMTPKTAMAGKGYLSEWARIAGEAEKQFHPSGSNARHIIFTGDSRVIAVPVSGKPEVYDMDNNNSRERPAFEKLYGKLPDCVPSPGFSLPAAPATHAFSGPASFRPARVAAALRATDTVPKKADSTGKDASGSVTPIQMRLKGIPDNVLYVVNDVVMPDGWTFDTIPPEKIFSINILKDKAAVSVFGDRAVNGVIEITTKGYHGEFSRLHPIDPNDALHQPLYIVDGKVAGPGVFKNVDPDRILSIEILKDKKALDKYGESGKNGIVLVHTKDGKGPEPVTAKPSSIPGSLYPGGEHI